LQQLEHRTPLAAMRSGGRPERCDQKKMAFGRADLQPLWAEIQDL